MLYASGRLCFVIVAFLGLVSTHILELNDVFLVTICALTTDLRENVREWQLFNITFVPSVKWSTMKGKNVFTSDANSFL